MLLFTAFFLLLLFLSCCCCSCSSLVDAFTALLLALSITFDLSSSWIFYSVYLFFFLSRVVFKSKRMNLQRGSFVLFPLFDSDSNVCMCTRTYKIRVLFCHLNAFVWMRFSVFSRSFFRLLITSSLSMSRNDSSDTKNRQFYTDWTSPVSGRNSLLVKPIHQQWAKQKWTSTSKAANP